jgi:hypothetical protein
MHQQASTVGVCSRLPIVPHRGLTRQALAERMVFTIPRLAMFPAERPRTGAGSSPVHYMDGLLTPGMVFTIPSAGHDIGAEDGACRPGGGGEWR